MVGPQLREFARTDAELTFSELVRPASTAEFIARWGEFNLIHPYCVIVE